MPYKLPKRVVRGNDSLDVDQMRRDLGDVSEHIASGLNEHAFAERTNDILIEDEALVRINSMDENVPVGFGSSPHSGPPALTANWSSDSVILPNTGVWEVIDTLPAFTTNGPEILHIKGKINYGWTGFRLAGTHDHAWSNEWEQKTVISSSGTDQPWETPHVLIALRVNGQIYNKCGHRHLSYRPYIPLKGTTEIQDMLGLNVGNANEGGWPGIISWRTEPCQAPGRWLMNVGINQLIYTPVGATLVEVVAMRLPKLRQHKYNTDDTIAINTRTLSVIRYRADYDRTRNTVGVTYTKPTLGNTIDSTNLFTNGIEPMETRLNSLQVDDIGTLNRYNTPSIMVKAATGEPCVGWGGVDYSSAPMTTDNFMPGETTSTFVTIGTLTGSSGWTPVQSGGTEFLVQINDSGVPPSLPTSTRYGKIVIWGSIVVRSIKKQGAAFWENIESEQHMAAVGVYYKYGSTRVLINSSVVPISRRTTPKALDSYQAVGSGTIQDQVKPALHCELDLTSGLLFNDLDGFGICVAAINTNSTNRVDVVVSHANLSFEFYRK